MFSVKYPRSLSLLACGAALLASAPVLADTLVVRASGPSAGSYAPGRKLADGASVTLKSGDVLTLLDGKGTRTLRGPGVFGTSVAATGGNASKFASLIGTRTTVRARTGAIRSGASDAPPPRSPNLWYVDVRSSATTCIADPANVVLWRADKGTAQTFTVTGKDGKGSIAFAADQATAAWPATLPVTEGATYQLTGGGKPVSLRFTLLAPGGEGLESTASTLIARKCDAQLQLLIET
ncbi:MAG: hypothetical protein ABW192_05130, partial [Sphingobium sp.]